MDKFPTIVLGSSAAFLLYYLRTNSWTFCMVIVCLLAAAFHLQSTACPVDWTLLVEAFVIAGIVYWFCGWHARCMGHHE